MSVFVRTDRRTFERVFFHGGKVAVDKNGPSGREDVLIRNDTLGHTFTSTPDLFDLMAGDAPSRPGEAYNYYIAMEAGGDHAD